MKLIAPFPYFGGKKTIAHRVWGVLGDVPNYVEPFAGSLAVLLQRPHTPKIETVNDKDGFISNFWRALKWDADGVSDYANWPVNENDLHARHYWLMQQKENLQAKLEGDPDWYDVKIAGWWVWGMACWIGGGFCSGDGPWNVVDGKMVKSANNGNGIARRLPHLGNAGRGINRRCSDIHGYLSQLGERLQRVRVCCGDWSRVCGSGVTCHNGTTGVFLDPPYSEEAGRAEVYTCEDLSVAHEVREWAIDAGKHPKMRVVLCGYEGEHAMPEDWHVIEWKAQGGMAHLGYGRGKENRHRERLWYSPHCLEPNDMPLFRGASSRPQEGEE